MSTPSSALDVRRPPASKSMASWMRRPGTYDRRTTVAGPTPDGSAVASRRTEADTPTSTRTALRTVRRTREAEVPAQRVRQQPGHLRGALPGGVLEHGHQVDPLRLQPPEGLAVVREVDADRRVVRRRHG